MDMKVAAFANGLRVSEWHPYGHDAKTSIEVLPQTQVTSVKIVDRDGVLIADLPPGPHGHVACANRGDSIELPPDWLEVR